VTTLLHHEPVFRIRADRFDDRILIHRLSGSN
jgi:hypothetical protein